MGQLGYKVTFSLYSRQVYSRLWFSRDFTVIFTFNPNNCTWVSWILYIYITYIHVFYSVRIIFVLCLFILFTCQLFTQLTVLCELDGWGSMDIIHTSVLPPQGNNNQRLRRRPRSINSSIFKDQYFLFPLQCYTLV